MFKKRISLSHNPFAPDYVVDKVSNIDFEMLHNAGIRVCLIDLDGTVVERGKYEVDAMAKSALKSAPMSFYIATNRPKSRDLKELKADLRADGVVHPKGIFGKPLKMYYTSARRDLSLKENEVAMIGDRFIQDIYGANRAGLKTILITHKVGRPQGMIDRMISEIEEYIARRMAKNYK